MSAQSHLAILHEIVFTELLLSAGNSLREQIQGEIISMRDSTEKVNQKKSWWKNLIGEMEGQSDPYKSDYLVRRVSSAFAPRLTCALKGARAAF